VYTYLAYEDGVGASPAPYAKFICSLEMKSFFNPASPCPEDSLFSTLLQIWVRPHLRSAKFPDFSRSLVLWSFAMHTVTVISILLFAPFGTFAQRQRTSTDAKCGGNNGYTCLNSGKSNIKWLVNNN
jgi:hypothetical protein